jgi:hypothetical protein
MANTMKALKRAVKAVAAKPFVRYRAGDTPVICSQCRGDTFYPSISGFRSVAGFSLQCERCSHLEYFQKRPTKQDK